MDPDRDLALLVDALCAIPGADVALGHVGAVARFPLAHAAEALAVATSCGLTVQHEDRFDVTARLNGRLVLLRAVTTRLHASWAVSHVALQPAGVLSGLTGDPSLPDLAHAVDALTDTARAHLNGGAFGTPLAPTPAEDTLARLLLEAVGLRDRDTEPEDDTVAGLAYALLGRHPDLVPVARALTTGAVAHPPAQARTRPAARTAGR